MSLKFEELDYCPTPIGALSLRRRVDVRLGKEVYEIKLGADFLMSSAFTASEIALASVALDALNGDGIDVVVGGLGLGYTAKAVLDHPSIRSMVVVEAFEGIIDWHRLGLVPLGLELEADHRCRFMQGDFFALAKSADGFDADMPSRKFDAVLVDIDHAPDAVLDPSNAEFYTEAGLARVVYHLRPGGIFGLWSNDPPNPLFTARLGHVFADARGIPVCFHNPLQDNTATQTIYLARAPPEAATGAGGCL